MANRVKNGTEFTKTKNRGARVSGSPGLRLLRSLSLRSADGKGVRDTTTFRLRKAAATA